jgi:pyruvate dehydrogenase E1 component beta subunit
MTFTDAVDAAMREEMRRDKKVFAMGTLPIGSPLQEEFGAERVRVTPISESSSVGMAVGAAGAGFRPIVLLSNVAFSFVAADQICNQAARIRFMFGAQAEFPLVLRAGYWNGSRAAAQHSQTGYALYSHIGGIKIVAPSSPAQAKGLLKTAIRDNNPVFFFEAFRLAGAEEGVGDEDDLIPFGVARTVREGTDVTIVAIAYMVTVARAAADALAERGISAEIIDPRTLVPLDLEAIHSSVKKTGRLVVVDESFPTCSFASEVIAGVVEDPEVMAALQGAPQRVCTAPIPTPFAATLEDFMLPDANDVVRAVERVLA